MDELAQKMLEGIVEKFKKISVFENLGNEEKAIEILMDISDDEICLLETLANTYTEIANAIREAKEEAKEEN